MMRLSIVTMMRLSILRGDVFSISGSGEIE